MEKHFKVIREGLAVGRFGCVFGDNSVAPGFDPIMFEVEGDGGDLNGEEFFVKPFRFLSQALTPYRYFDFSKDGVLKAGVSLFDQLTIYANHNADVNQWKGFTQKPYWDEKNEPAGINGFMVLDRTVDANLARGVEIGALRSASVTIWFEYEKSHPDLRYYYDHLGEEVDGEIVRFIVTKLVRVGEVSVVWEGEDPYAKALSAESMELGAGSEKDGTGENDNLSHFNLNQGGEDMDFSKDFLKALGIVVPENGDVTSQTLESAVNEKISGMSHEIENLKADAAIGKKHLEGLRERATTLYKALKGDDAKENYTTNVIEKADLETAQALVDEYQAGVEETVPLNCPKCGEKLSRQSSVQSSASSENGDRKEPVKISDYKFSK